MDKYWMRIGFRAVVIFGIGMLVWTGVSFGKSKVQRLVESNDPITIPIGFLPFNVDGSRMGTVRSLRLSRNEQQRLTDVQVNVRLGDRADAERLPSCDLYLADTKNIDEHSSFSCVPQELVQSGAVQRVGHVVLTPTDRRIPIWGDSAAVGEMMRAKIGGNSDLTEQHVEAQVATEVAHGLAVAGIGDSMQAGRTIVSANGDKVTMQHDANGLRISVSGVDGQRVDVVAGAAGVHVNRQGDEEAARLANAYADAKTSAAAARSRGDQRVSARAEDRANDILEEMDDFSPQQFAHVLQVTTRLAGPEAALPVQLKARRVLEEQQRGDSDHPEQHTP